MSLDFFASNEAQQQQSNFHDKRFNRPIQWLKFSPESKGQRIDILPVSDTKTHAIIKHHQLPGALVLCPSNFGEPCPLCDAIAINRNDKWYWDNFKTKDRALFNAIPINKEGKVAKMHQDHTVPVYLYEVSAPPKKAQGFWMLLTGQLGSSDPEDAFKKQFFSWDKGSTLKLTLTKDAWNGAEFAKVTSIEFVHPRNDYSKERAKWEPHLYKIPDIYQKPDIAELNSYLERMQASRDSSYKAQVPSAGGGFYAGGQAPTPGTSAWAVANDDADQVF
jgi:hypothetical protein